MSGVIGLDIGGVNTKAVWRDGDATRTVLRPYDVVRDREALTAVVREVMAELAGEPPELVALTMTAELSDEFRTKREGVGFVLDAVEAAVSGQVLVFTTAGELVSLAEARARPLDVAAANWVASALAVAALHPDALMLDVGSTTADVIPIAAGRVAAAGRTDLDRLLAGELVYTGALRTNLAAIAPRVPVRGRWCPVASELFAISGDVHLLLGHLAPEAYTCPTPDGRAASVECARERVARLVCADVEQLEPAEIEAIAAYLHGEQVRQIEAAARRVGTDAAGRAARRRRVPRPRGGGATRPPRPRAAVEHGAARRGARGGARRPRGRPPGRGVLTVVKVGGGLARDAGDEALRALCTAIAEAAARHPLLVVPGGGEFADAVRAHDRRFRPDAAGRAPDGDPGDGPVRLGARGPDPGCGALLGPRVAARRCRLGPVAGGAARRA